MNRKSFFSIILTYVPFIGLLAVYIMSLYQGATTIRVEPERSIRIWTDALLLNAIIGVIGSLMVIKRFTALLTGKTPVFILDIQEERSEDIAVAYNGLIVSTFFITVLIALYIWYTRSQNRLLLNISLIVATAFAVVTIIYMLVIFLKAKTAQSNSISSKLSNPIFLPMVICTILLLITQKNVVGFVYRNILQPQNDILRIIAIIIVICYFLAAAFCHFINLYCLVGFAFEKKDYKKIKCQIDLLLEKNQNIEESLRKATKYVDKRAEEVRIIKKCWLAIYFFFIHIKTFFLDRYYAVQYLFLFTNFRITKWLSCLLIPERIRINGIRFFWSIAVLELLALDFLLFIYLDSDDPCLKFFELLSTVIIIPVLLSWIGELKTIKN